MYVRQAAPEEKQFGVHTLELKTDCSSPNTAMQTKLKSDTECYVMYRWLL